MLSRARVAGRSALVMSDVLLCRHLHLVPRFAPVLLMYITWRCNLRCATCGVCLRGEQLGPSHELSLEKWKAGVRSAAKLRTIIALISGGEPLLRPDVLFDLASHARDMGVAVHVCTNGVLLDRDAAVQFEKAGVKTVSISIDAPERDVHDRLRGKGSFEGAVEGIRVLRSFAPSVNVGINSVVTTQNFRYMAAMVPFAESLGVHQLKIAPVHGNLLHTLKSPDLQELVFKEEDLPELREELGNVRRALAGSKLLTTSPLFLERSADLFSAPPRFRCFAGYAIATIDPTGMVSPCADMEGVASIRDKPLEEIWRSREFQAARMRVRHCTSRCWDAANAELSIRLRARFLISRTLQIWKDLGFYFDAGHGS